MLDFTIESELEKEGFVAVCGVDEAGRGPLCGPVFAAACILPRDYHPEELNDSKKLTPKKRDRLYCEIKHAAPPWSNAPA